MIYILKKSKKKEKEKILTFSLEQAKDFLFNLGRTDFMFSDFVVFSTDSVYEGVSLRDFFIDDFLIKKTVDMFDSLLVNENIEKTKRIRHQGIRINNLNNFLEKIKKETSCSNVKIDKKSDFFEMEISFDKDKIKFLINYKLEIISTIHTEVSEKTVEFISLLKKKINHIFRQQRYYYKKKVKTDGDA